MKLAKKRASDEMTLTLDPTVQYRISLKKRNVATHIVDIVDIIAENCAISTEPQPERIKADE